MRRRFKKGDILEVVKLTGGILFTLNLNYNQAFPEVKIGDTFICEEDEAYQMVTVKSDIGNWQLYSSQFKSIEAERIKPAPLESYLIKNKFFFFDINKKNKEVIIVTKLWFWLLILILILAQSITYFCR